MMLHNLQEALCAASRCRDEFKSAGASGGERFIIGCNNTPLGLQHLLYSKREFFRNRHGVYSRFKKLRGQVEFSAACIPSDLSP